MACAASTEMLDEAWDLSPSVSLRPEPFGALAYHFGNRRLTFLKRPELVSLVRGLGVTKTCAPRWRAEVPPAQWPAYVGALRGLADTDMIRPREARGPVEGTTHDRAGHSPPGRRPAAGGSLIEQFELGLDAPICLTWELTYACNLSCAHCLSSSGRRDPDELSTEQCEAVIDELQRMQVFYVNIGGGEPTIRPDFWHLLEYAVNHDVGVKFSTNGVRINPERAAFLASTDYVDVQISLDGATAEVNDYVRGPGSYDTAIKALKNLRTPGSRTPRSRSS